MGKSNSGSSHASTVRAHRARRSRDGTAAATQCRVASTMAGKIQRQKLAKGGSRGRYGVSGLSAFRSKSRPARRAPIARNRGADYEKFVELRAEVDALSAEEAKGTLDKATAKELKNLRAKLTLKERKHGGGA